MFLFDHLPGAQWGLVLLALVGWAMVHRVLKRRRRREQLRRRRQIRARLHETMLHGTMPVTEIDLTEPPPVLEIDLRDGVVYGSQITLESGDTLETGIVGPD